MTLWLGLVIVASLSFAGYHKGFRKTLLWTGAIAAGILLLVLGNSFLLEYRQQKRTDKTSVPNLKTDSPAVDCSN